MSTISILLSSVGSRMPFMNTLLYAALVFPALNSLGDPLDTPEPGVPGCPHRGQLRDRASKLRLVHPVPPLSPRRRGVHQADAVEHTEMFRDGLPCHGQLLTEAGGRAIAIRQEQVEHPPTGRIPDRGPQVVVDGGGHEVDTRRASSSPRGGTTVS